MKKRAFYWKILIVLDVGLFLYGFIYKNWVLSLVALGLILMVRIFAYDLLFKSFDEKWDERHRNYTKKKEGN
ncbi:hypothetical protein LQF61_03485 [Tetragenococcus koreensis]|uniref:Uncharacterized protein n=1 Tax=Tetragenococcus koreensis TaxID=290335 RepID=A0AAN4UCM7_9ENTE|nr:hypothetical protein [Tetragenococcus koreensis]MDN6473877.1 hypothetical protein [Lactococcus lactis]MDN6751204.1 hypothetical protein [Staphylococcus equorum]AYW46635.1 hypothetical protein C7K43_12280 [Tetragenococcus koreensis]MCF1586439.1 hypothetical protein [Tetragenococcus koreensis]MCF1615989.1 hypothetical protein [Tetragenococcus koreensis]